MSDVHLESEEDSKFFLWDKFLKQIESDPHVTHFFLLGDIFDLWVADHRYFSHRFAGTLSTLERITRRGVEVHYFEGNHDLDLEPYFAKRGVIVHEGAVQMRLGPRCARLEHGDQMDPEDRGYLFLRWLLRTRVMRWVGRHLPGMFVQRLGTFMSSTSRKYTDRLKENLAAELAARREKIFEKIRAHVRALEQKGENFDLFVSGHVHERFHEKMVIDEKRVEVINLGCWLGDERPYLVLEAGEGSSFAAAQLHQFEEAL